MSVTDDSTDPDFPKQRDANDPLESFPSQFYVADSDTCYLDGNSLGRLPLSTKDSIESFLVNEWGTQLVEGWSHWIDEAERAGDLLAEAALGAGPGQTLVADTTSVNLYQLLRAVVDSRPDKSTVIVDSANFPTDRYIAEGIAQHMGKNIITLDVDGAGGPGSMPVDAEYERITPELLEPLLTDDVAVLTLQAVNYRSGARPDMKAINALAKSKGIPVVWDCAHAVGSIALNFDEVGIDLAVGCTYKYLNSGPGSPAWLFVRRELQDQLQVPIQGWFAQADQFAMGAGFDKANSIRGFQIASPSIVGIRSVQSSLAMVKEATIAAIEDKARMGTSMMVDLFDAWLEPLGFDLLTPREPSWRGGHITLGHSDAKKIAQAMRVVSKVIPDYREPSSIRVAMSPLASTYTEVWEGFRRTRDLVASGDYLNVSDEGSRVT
jgi:kynureninase